MLLPVVVRSEDCLTRRCYAGGPHLVFRLFVTEQSIFSSRQLLQGSLSSTLQRILRHWQKEHALLARFLKLLAAGIDEVWGEAWPLLG